MYFSYLQELFIQDLAQRTLEEAKDKQHMEYSDLAEIVNENESLQFLQGMYVGIFYFIVSSERRDNPLSAIEVLNLVEMDNYQSDDNPNYRFSSPPVHKIVD